MKSIKSIVTGGAGFIGSHLVDLLLSHGHEVHVIDNFRGGHKSNLSTHNGDPKLLIHEIDILEIDSTSPIFRSADYVFHLAGIGDIVPSIEYPEEYFRVNVQGTVRVLEASRKNLARKFIYAASSSCYGLAEVPTREDTKINPAYPYAMSKYLGEQLVFHWSKVYKLPVNSICIFNAYGTRVRTTGAYGAVFGVFLKQKLSGEPFTVVGDGNQTRDFVYVTDVAKAFLLAAQTSINGERFNIGAGNPKSINQLVSLLGGSQVHIPRRPGEPETTHADIQKARDLLKWAPTIEFEQGVKIMLESIKDWDGAPLWKPKDIEEATSAWFEYMSDLS